LLHLEKLEPMVLPLYPIIDVFCFAARRDYIRAIAQDGEELIAAGATLIHLGNNA
jgi:hypothetical protein